jgi:hypothetical protein
MRSYPHEVSSEQGGQHIRHEVVRTERVRRAVTVRLGSTQAIRLGAKLVFRGLLAKVRRRPVQLTLHNDTERSTSIELAGADEVAERSLESAAPGDPASGSDDTPER